MIERAVLFFSVDRNHTLDALEEAGHEPLGGGVFRASRDSTSVPGKTNLVCQPNSECNSLPKVSPRSAFCLTYVVACTIRAGSHGINRDYECRGPWRPARGGRGEVSTDE